MVTFPRRKHDAMKRHIMVESISQSALNPEAQIKRACFMKPVDTSPAFRIPCTLQAGVGDEISEETLTKNLGFEIDSPFRIRTTQFQL